ncbi:flippase [Shewanella colwelliana]|uniref:flippase n=1 Tax=Shewanella colwelliana TaxID=23 RepID=UPI00299F4F73|nr:flippase [Shewanella colwelliana]MDX1281572.1 flippase [Shewanella colwelliana]
MKLYRYSLYNALGLGLPLVFAIFSIPYLLGELGDAQFGVLTLIWAMVSYFGLFDLGLGRAMTQLISPLFLKDSEVNRKKAGEIAFNGNLLLLLLGTGVLVILLLFGDTITANIEGMSNYSQFQQTIVVVALTMPAIMLTNGLRGILEANNDFAIVNLIRLPMGIWNFIGPCAVCYLFSSNLFLITVSLALGRWVATFVHLYFVFGMLSKKKIQFTFSATHTKLLVSSGGWMAVSNVISSLMGYLDRFIIAFSLSALAVSYYSIPHEMITKLWIIPTAITASIFPTFSNKINIMQRKVVFKKAVLLNLIFILPICLIVMVFAKDILSLWINSGFSTNSYKVLIILSLGMLIGSFASVPYTAMQAMGYQKKTALIHCCELVVFVGVIYFLTVTYGVIGAAIAWTIRAVIDTAVMYYFYNKYNKVESSYEC